MLQGGGATLPLHFGEHRLKIELRFFADLRRYLPGDGAPHLAELAEGATVADVLAAYSIPADKPRIILINGIHADKSARLEEGDVLALFPPVAGG